MSIENDQYIDTHQKLKLLFDRYAASVALVETKLNDGSIRCGSAYHIGDNVYLTAKHVVQDKDILRVATTIGSHWPIGDTIPDTPEEMEKSKAQVFIHLGNGELQPSKTYTPSDGKIIEGPFFHPNDDIDLAAFIIDGIEAPAIPLGSHLDDWIGYDLVLSQVLVMGYPPIPLSTEPLLYSTVGTINSIVDLYSDPIVDRHPRFILSCQSRGGFSGGVAISEYGFSLGVITESLVSDHNIADLGYMAVMTIQPVLDLLDHHKIVPNELKEFWGKDDPEFWSY